MGRDEFVWEITEWTPNKSVAMKYESDKFAGDGAYGVDATDGGTRDHQQPGWCVPVSSGVYIYMLQSDSFTAVKKMILIK